MRRSVRLTNTPRPPPVACRVKSGGGTTRGKACPHGSTGASSLGASLLGVCVFTPSDTTMIKAVKFVSIPVHDQARALAFYTEKLGCEITTDAPMGPGMRWIELAFPGAETGVVLFTAPGQESWIGGFMNMSFACADVHATAAELASRGVEFVQPAKTESWGTSAIFKDSEGNQFVLSSQ